MENIWKPWLINNGWNKNLSEEQSIGNFEARRMVASASTSASNEGAYSLQEFNVQM